MASNVYYLRGTFHWAKIVGDPVPNYSKDGHEWVIDVTPDEEGLKLLKKLKLSSKIKDKDDERGEFIQFKQRYERVNRNTGEVTYNKAPTIVDKDGKPWGDDKIGNLSEGDIKFTVIPYGTTTGVYIQGVRVLKHVPYEGGSGFPPLTADDEYWAEDSGKVKDESEAKEKKSLPGKTIIEDLDDEIPY